MPYEPELSSRASAKLASLEERLRGPVVEGLYRLAESPTLLSRRAPSPPYLPGFQMFEFEHEGHRFTILFKYKADEQTLFIHGIGHVAPPPPER